MASSYSTDLKLELMVTGENAGTWGDNTNNNLNLIQQAIAGYEAVALSDGGTVALAMTDKTISNARNMVLKFTGTLTSASEVTIPDSIEKFYIFDCSAVVGPTNLTIKTASGTGFTLNAAKIFAAYSDGTDLNEISLDTLGGTIAFADVTGTVSTSQIADNAITSAKISDNQIITAKISDNQITTAKIANDAVGPDQLSDTAVTPAEYTSATITVDQQGRITAASSGAAGGGAFEPKLLLQGGASGTYTANADTGYIGIYAVGGGGGGGIKGTGPNGGTGGSGYYGYIGSSISQPFAQPYSVGNGGAPQGAGAATSLATIFNFNGGSAGNPGAPGGVGGNTGASGNTGNPASVFYPNTFRTFTNTSDGSGGAGGGPTTPINSSSPGQGGFLLLFENTGV